MTKPKTCVWKWEEEAPERIKTGNYESFWIIGCNYNEIAFKDEYDLNGNCPHCKNKIEVKK